MRKLLMFVVSFFIIFTVFGLATPVNAQTCSDPQQCDATLGGNCVGNCVPCSKTVYYLGGPYGDQRFSCQVNTTCCNNGWCTVCDSDGGCYTNGCPTGGDGGGDTPTPTPTTAPSEGTIRAKAVYVDSGVTSCAAIAGSSTVINNTQFTVSPAVSPATQIQGVGFVMWYNAPGGVTYSLSDIPVAGENYVKTCVTKNGGATYADAESIFLSAGETATFYYAYTHPLGNIQAKAVYVDYGVTSCAAIAGSAIVVNSTQFTISPAVTPVTKTQGAGFVTWSNVPGDITYALSDTPVSGKNYVKTCVTKNGGATYAAAESILVNNAETATFYYAYTNPVGNIRVRSALVPISALVCSQMTSNYVADSVTMSPPGSTKPVTGDGSYATWNTVPVGLYTVTGNPGGDYSQKLSCWQTDIPAAGPNNGSQAAVSDTATLTWNLGYSAGSKWYQSQGGNMYAATSMKSYIPRAGTRKNSRRLP